MRRRAVSSENLRARRALEQGVFERESSRSDNVSVVNRGRTVSAGELQGSSSKECKECQLVASVIKHRASASIERQRAASISERRALSSSDPVRVVEQREGSQAARVVED